MDNKNNNNSEIDFDTKIFFEKENGNEKKKSLKNSNFQAFQTKKELSDYISIDECNENESTFSKVDTLCLDSNQNDSSFEFYEKDSNFYSSKSTRSSYSKNEKQENLFYNDSRIKFNFLDEELNRNYEKFEIIKRNSKQINEYKFNFLDNIFSTNYAIGLRNFTNKNDIACNNDNRRKNEMNCDVISSSLTTHYKKDKGQTNYGPIFKKDLKNILIGKLTTTAVMIKNIPNRYDPITLKHDIDIFFKDQYDVLYLVMDFKNKCNLGYAFINFIHPFSILSFHKLFNGKYWKRFNSTKICEIAFSKIQGKDNLMKHYDKGAVGSYEDKYKPIVIEHFRKCLQIEIPMEYYGLYKRYYYKGTGITIEEWFRKVRITEDKQWFIVNIKTNNSSNVNKDIIRHAHNANIPNKNICISDEYNLFHEFQGIPVSVVVPKKELLIYKYCGSYA